MQKKTKLKDFMQHKSYNISFNKTIYILLIALLTLSNSQLAYSVPKKNPSWQSNYKPPDYFNKADQNRMQYKTSKILNPDDDNITSYIFEIRNYNPESGIDYIKKAYNDYFTKNDIKVKSIISTKSVNIFVLHKTKPFDSKDFHAKFGKTLSWFLLNRRDSTVTIRPIFNNNKRPEFLTQHVINMDKPKVITGDISDEFLDPEKTIIDGYHIHMDYLDGQEEEARKLFDVFKTHITEKKLVYSDLDWYPERSNGPHIRAGWEIKFERAGVNLISEYGYTIAWLMLNHNNIPIYSHSKSWIFGENEKRLISHLDNALYSGVKPKLNQWFFYDPDNENTGLYRWDSQLPANVNITTQENLDKQKEILNFWFGENYGEYPTLQSKKWFRKQKESNNEFDDEIKNKFLQDIFLLVNGYYTNWLNTAEGTLAYIIMLDQFPRNIYRGKPMVLAYDNLALKAAKSAIEANLDKTLDLAQRLFLYMPLEHSENIEDQQLSVSLVSKLRDEAPESLKDTFDVHYDMALKHYKTIEKFGNCLSRNKIFGKKYNETEEKFIKELDGGF